MDKNTTKASQIINCPHCGKEFYTTHSITMNGITGVATGEEINKIKADLVESIASGELRTIMKPEDRGSALEWLKDPANILMPGDLEQFLKDIK